MSLFCSHRFRCAKPSFFTGPQNPRPSAACPGAADRFITTKPGSLQMLDKATSYDLSHELVSVMDPLPPIEAQRKGERGGEVARVGWRELLSGARASADGSSALRQREIKVCRGANRHRALEQTMSRSALPNVSLRPEKSPLDFLNWPANLPN